MQAYHPHISDGKVRPRCPCPVPNRGESRPAHESGWRTQSATTPVLSVSGGSGAPTGRDPSPQRSREIVRVGRIRTQNDTISRFVASFVGSNLSDISRSYGISVYRAKGSEIIITPTSDKPRDGGFANLSPTGSLRNIHLMMFGCRPASRETASGIGPGHKRTCAPRRKIGGVVHDTLVVASAIVDTTSTQAGQIDSKVGICFAQFVCCARLSGDATFKLISAAALGYSAHSHRISVACRAR